MDDVCVVDVRVASTELRRAKSPPWKPPPAKPPPKPLRRNHRRSVDEDRSRSGRAAQTSFQNGNVECERIAVQLWRFQSHHGVLTSDPSPPSTDTVAFGGSTAKLSLPSSHCMMNCSVVTCPAARTGRSAKTIEFADTPVRIELFVLNLGSRRIDDRQRRHRTGGRDWPMRLFQRHMWLLGGILRDCSSGGQGKASKQRLSMLRRNG